MRTVTADDFDVYTLDELEPEARRRAIGEVAEKLGSTWWDSNDNDDISDVMRYTLANKFGTPGHGDFGVGDFPGITGVTLQSWDLDRGNYIGLTGVLTRQNAPALPWTDGVEQVALREGNEYTSIDVEFDDTLAEPDMELVNDQMTEAITDAMHEALRDGRAEMEYKTGEEYAAGFIEGNGLEFLEDGTQYP